MSDEDLEKWKEEKWVPFSDAYKFVNPPVPEEVEARQRKAEG